MRAKSLSDTYFKPCWFVLLFLAVILSLLNFGAATAAEHFRSLYRHNGSIVEFHASFNIGSPDGRFSIIYRIPRQGLVQAGIRAGDTLVQGDLNEAGQISGTAYRFKRGCRPVSYPVTGQMSGNRISLHGTAPSRPGRGCEVSGRFADALEFDLVQDASHYPL